MAFREINLTKKTGLVPSYLKDLFKKKKKKEVEKLDIEIEVKNNNEEIEIDVDKVKVKIVSEPKKDKKEEKAKQVIAKQDKKEEVEEVKEDDSAIKNVSQLKSMFKDELVQLAKSLKIDEKGNKADIIDRIAKYLKLS